MISYRKEIEALFDIYENDLHLTEQEIFERSNKSIKEHKFNRDYMFDLNDVLHFRGYSFQYDIPHLEKRIFDKDEYALVIENSTKSKDKTNNLILYLKEVNDWRLSLCSLHALKTKYLVELGILPSDNVYINNNLKSNLRDLFFNAYFSKDYDVILPCLEKVGILYSTLNYMIFRLDIEFLLWSIEQKDKNKGFIKANTIKIAFNIAPLDFFIRNDKYYYDQQFAEKLNQYLKLIDRKSLDFVKNEWNDKIEQLDDTGYKLLFKIL